MGFAVAHGADFRFAPGTLPNVSTNLLRLYPFPAVWLRTVDTVRRCVFNIFLVP